MQTATFLDCKVFHSRSFHRPLVQVPRRKCQQIGGNLPGSWSAITAVRPSQSDSTASCKGCIPSTRWLLASPTQSCREFVGARSIVGSPMKSSWQQETWVTSKLNARSSAIEHHCAISLNSSQKSLHTCDVNTSHSPKFSECSPGCQVSLKLKFPGRVVIWILQITPSGFTRLQSFRNAMTYWP